MEGRAAVGEEVAGREGDLARAGFVLERMRDQAELLAEVFQNGWRLRELEPRSRVAQDRRRKVPGTGQKCLGVLARIVATGVGSLGYAAMISGIPSPCIVYFTSAAAKTSLTNSARPRKAPPPQYTISHLSPPFCSLFLFFCLPRPPDQRIPRLSARIEVMSIATDLLYLDERRHTQVTQPRNRC